MALFIYSLYINITVDGCDREMQRGSESDSIYRSGLCEDLEQEENRESVFVY